MKPRYKHDSTCCTYLGSGDAEGGFFDHYICPRYMGQQVGVTLLSRWSDEPSHNITCDPDWASQIAARGRSDYAGVRCWQMAKEKGLL